MMTGGDDKTNSFVNLRTFSIVLFIGCEGIQVEELWSLDQEQFKNLEWVFTFDWALNFNCILFSSISIRSPIHGLIFLFKWVQHDEPGGPIVQDSRLEKIFFAKQVCALFDERWLLVCFEFVYCYDRSSTMHAQLKPFSASCWTANTLTSSWAPNWLTLKIFACHSMHTTKG